MERPSSWGAVTWGSGTAGVIGVDLRRQQPGGQHTPAIMSACGVIALTNGNYVVSSPDWD